MARSGDPYSDRINTMTKYVVSSTLRDPEWNNTTVISGDPIAEIRRLKEQPGQDKGKQQAQRTAEPVPDAGDRQACRGLDGFVRLGPLAQRRLAVHQGAVGESGLSSLKGDAST